MKEALKNQYHQFILKNYAPPPIALERGEGCWVWDDQGKKYLDFTSGIAVNSLGHAHPEWVSAIQHQASILGHASNLFAIPGQGELAAALARHTPPGAFLFCNSGAEANEALIKLARLHGVRKSGREGACHRIVCAVNAFHGRTFGGMAATPQEKIQKGFRPMLEGFDFAPLNDLDRFASLIGPETAAVFIETIQGEGGIFEADASFLRDLRSLCSEREVMLMVDEVQCGIGRTGDIFAYQKSGIEPDAIGMAKGLGSGFPIGAIWVGDRYRDLFQPGSHGTTFGGSPLACAAAISVLRVIEKDHLLERVRAGGALLQERTGTWPKRFPDRVAEIRGRGYLMGIGLKVDPAPLVAELRQAGLLVPPAGNQTIRILPPLIAGPKEIGACCDIFESVLAVCRT